MAKICFISLSGPSPSNSLKCLRSAPSWRSPQKLIEVCTVFCQPSRERANRSDLSVSLEEISSGSRELLNGLQKIRRDLEARMLNADDGYTRRMFPFTAVAEDRVEALRDMVQAGARAFNEVKQYYGEGDDKYDAVTNPVALSRPTSLEFFGTFKAFVTSYDVSVICQASFKRES